MGQDKQYDAIPGRIAFEGVGRRCCVDLHFDRLHCLGQRGLEVL